MSTEAITKALQEMLDRFGGSFRGRVDQPKTFGCYHTAETCLNCEGLVSGWKAVQGAEAALSQQAEAQPAQPPHPERHLTVTVTEAGEAVAVSWQDDEHRILEVAWSRKSKPAQRADIRDSEEELNCAERVLDAITCEFSEAEFTKTDFDCIGDYITAVISVYKARVQALQAGDVTDEQIVDLFSGDSPFVARRTLDKSAYEVVQQTNSDWREVTGDNDDFAHHGYFPTHDDADTVRRRLHDRWVLSQLNSPTGVEGETP